MAQQFGPYSESEVAEAFKCFDLDHNNYVGAGELRHIFDKMGEQVTDEELEEMIHLVDGDGDGQVTLNEFARLIFKYAGKKEDEQNNDQDHTQLLVNTNKPNQKRKIVNSSVNSVETPSIPLFSLSQSHHHHMRLHALLLKLNINSNRIRDKIQFVTDNNDKLREKLNKEQFCYFWNIENKAKMLDNIINQDISDDSEVEEYNEANDSTYPKQIHAIYAILGKDEPLRTGSSIFYLFASNALVINFYIVLDPETSGSIELVGFLVFDPVNHSEFTFNQLLDFLHSIYLSINAAQMIKKGEAIIRHIKNKNKKNNNNSSSNSNNVSLDEILSIQSQFPSLIFPSWMQGDSRVNDNNNDNNSNDSNGNTETNKGNDKFNNNIIHANTSISPPLPPPVGQRLNNFTSPLRALQRRTTTILSRSPINKKESRSNSVFSPVAGKVMRNDETARNQMINSNRAINNKSNKNNLTDPIKSATVVRTLHDSIGEDNSFKLNDGGETKNNLSLNVPEDITPTLTIMENNYSIN